MVQFPLGLPFLRKHLLNQDLLGLLFVLCSPDHLCPPSLPVGRGFPEVREILDFQDHPCILISKNLFAVFLHYFFFHTSRIIKRDVIQVFGKAILKLFQDSEWKKWLFFLLRTKITPYNEQIEKIKKN